MTLCIPIAAGADDGEWGSGSSGVFNDNNTLLRILDSAAFGVHIWLRFQIPIAQGVQIDNAFIRYRMHSNVNQVMDSFFRTDNVDDAPNPTSRADALSRATSGNPRVDWDEANITASAGDIVDSPDIKATIQANLDEAGWAANQFMTVYHVAQADMSITGFEFESYDGGSYDPPELCIDSPQTQTQALPQVFTI